MKNNDNSSYSAKKDEHNKIISEQSNKENTLPLTLLVVDDDQALQNLVRVKMISRGYNVLPAYDGVTAVSTLRENDVDLVLLDQNMPGRDGTQVFNEIKYNWPDLPVVMVTAHGSKHLIKEFLMSGGRDFIEKPIVDFEAFDFRIKRITREVIREKKARKELREAITREESQKAKNVLLTSMSHEIRTPLNSVKTMAYMLEKSGLTDKQNKHVITISKAVDNLLLLINNILDFSAVETGEFMVDHKSFNLGKLFTNLCSTFSERFIQKKVSFIVRIAPEVPYYLVGDPHSLKQVLTSLTDNGIKFTKTGLVEITVNLVETDGKHVILAFAVRDTGAGMTKEQCKKLFQPFTQIDGSITRAYGGVGIGLALSKKIVSLMQGDIRVESEIGHGSIFRFTASFEIDNKQKANNDLPRSHEIIINLPLDTASKIGFENQPREKGYRDKNASLLLLQQLAFMLRIHDAKAEKLLESFIKSGYPQAIEGELRQLTESIANFDFNRSIEILTIIAKKEGFSLKESE
ncbi:MAG: ATP-binding protein [Desulfobulbaceae bacterium]|nr:ATP-binding protein [Desulfobulbaceae bacterium]